MGVVEVRVEGVGGKGVEVAEDYVEGGGGGGGCDGYDGWVVGDCDGGG